MNRSSSLSPYIKTTPSTHQRGHYGRPRVAGPMLVEVVTSGVTTARAAVPEPHIDRTVTKIVGGAVVLGLGLGVIHAIADYKIATAPRPRRR